MRKIASAFILALLAWFSGSAMAFDTCDPNSPAVPCTYDGRNFDTVMYNNNVKVFYQAMSYYVDHTVNNDPDVNDVWKPAGSPCSQAVAWIYGTPYSSPCHVGVNTTAAGYGWIGRGAGITQYLSTLLNGYVWEYLSFPLYGYTAYDAGVSSVLDNGTLGTVTPYASERNGTISLFNSESGTAATGCHCSSTGLQCNSSNYSSCTVPGYLRSGGGNWTFTNTINYTGTYVYYDGHPGYDYPAAQSTAIYAPAGGKLCVAHSQTTKPSPASDYWRNTTHCPYAAAPGTTTTNWSSHHVFYIMHGSMLINGSADQYMTVFLHSNNLESSVVSGIYQDGYKEVTRLQEVAAVGDIGASGAYHVHMEVYKNVSGTWTRVDPYGNGTNNILWLNP